MRDFSIRFKGLIEGGYMHYDCKRTSGQVVPLVAVMAALLMGCAGLAVDLVRAYIVKVQMHAAIDAATLAAIRADGEDRSVVAEQVFTANFPDGYMGTGAVDLDIDVSGGGFTIRASAETPMPTYFMRWYGHDALDIAAFSEAQRPEGAKFLMLDEDNIDSGISLSGYGRMSIKEITETDPPKCGNGNTSVCVNDDIAGLYVRTLLFTRGRDITPYSGLWLPTGQVGDFGMFQFTNPDPQTSNQNGAQFTTQELISGTCAASDENNLDKIDGVKALGAAEINALLGKTVCALVWDSDISWDYSKVEGSLKGATKGLTAFTVQQVSPHPAGGSYLPLIRVDLIASSDVIDVCSTSGGTFGAALLTQ
jgi:hypothetical protein